MTLQKKHLGLIILLVSVILFVGILAAVIVDRKIPDQLSFQISICNSTTEIRLWEAADSDPATLYCFLPAAADLQSIRVNKRFPCDVMLDGKHVQDGECLPAILPGECHALQIGKASASLIFLQSEGVGTVFITISERQLQAILNDKTSKQKVSVTVWDQNGERNYHSAGTSDFLKGHGNSTWLLEKKPYALLLGEDAPLLGMTSSGKFLLLSNGYDDTDLRNAIVYSLAEGLSFSWTPDYRFVNLYINHQYQGLYLLAESVEPAPGKIDLPPESGCLLEANSLHRLKADEIGFTTQNGREMEIDWPTSPTEEECSRIRDRMQEVETLLLSSEDDARLWEKIDLQSWVDKYLCDEVFLNCDAERLSAFYYFDSSLPNGKIFAGPVWDYDLALANPNTTWSYRWQNANRLLSHFTPWYSALMQREPFRVQVTVTYRDVFRPRLIDLIENDFGEEAALIVKSAEMDEVRWRDLLPRKYGSRQESLSTMRTFLSERISFLDAVLLEQKDFHLITLQIPGQECSHYEILHGDTYLPPNDLTGVDTAHLLGWKNDATGERWDPGTPITEDISLSPFYSENANSSASATRKGLHPITIVCLSLCSLLGICGLLLLIVERKRQKGVRNGR